MSAAEADPQGELDFLQHVLLGALAVAVLVAGVTASLVRGSGPPLVTSAARQMFATSKAADSHLALGKTAAATVRSLHVKIPSSWSKPKAEFALVVRCDAGTVNVAVRHLSVSIPCSGQADEVIQLPSSGAGATVVATVNQAQRGPWGLALYR